jgi:selenide,water dikinase
LRGLPIGVDPNVLVGLKDPDDAAVVRLRDDLALVLTTDFFTPIVDDPRNFGRIAAANALSDIYAMGAQPLIALNLAGFPTKTLPLEILTEILRGGAEVAREAGIVIAGGHTIDDPEPKYGLVAAGTVHPDKVWKKGGAMVGDVLILTKALGTGILSTAVKRERITDASDAMKAAVVSMTTLNAGAARVIHDRKVPVHAATDVTGYGLAGHLLEMLNASSGVRAVIDTKALALLPDARVLAEEGFLAGGTKANREHIASALDMSTDVPDSLAWIACDAQTSGGLLVSVPESEAPALLRALRDEAGLNSANAIGRIEASAKPAIRLV